MIHSKKDLIDQNQTEYSAQVEDRTPYNDAIKHHDIVQGYHSPKHSEQFPSWYRNPRRIMTTLSLLGFLAVLIYQAIEVITSIFTN